MTLPDDIHFEKSSDPDCGNANGWVVFGRIVIEASSELPDGDSFPHSFHVSYNRKDEVYYNGEGATVVKEDGTIEVIVFVSESEEFIFEKVVFLRV